MVKETDAIWGVGRWGTFRWGVIHRASSPPFEQVTLTPKQRQLRRRKLPTLEDEYIEEHHEELLLLVQYLQNKLSN